MATVLIAMARDATLPRRIMTTMWGHRAKHPRLSCNDLRLFILGSRHTRSCLIDIHDIAHASTLVARLCIRPSFQRSIEEEHWVTYFWPVAMILTRYLLYYRDLQYARIERYILSKCIFLIILWARQLFQQHRAKHSAKSDHRAAFNRFLLFFGRFFTLFRIDYCDDLLRQATTGRRRHEMRQADIDCRADDSRNATSLYRWRYFRYHREALWHERLRQAISCGLDVFRGANLSAAASVIYNIYKPLWIIITFWMMLVRNYSIEGDNVGTTFMLVIIDSCLTRLFDTRSAI